MPTVKDVYDYLSTIGTEDPSSEIGWGDLSNGYAADNYGTFTLLVEVPLWTQEHANDGTPMEIGRRELLLQRLDKDEAFVAWMQSQLAAVKDDLRLNTPFHRAVSERLAYTKGRASAQRLWSHAATAAAPATKADYFTTVNFEEHRRQGCRGMFVRMMDAEIDYGNDSYAILASRESVVNELRAVGKALENELEYRLTPIRTAVSVQVCAGLATAIALRD